MLPHILILCFVATVGLALPLEKENAQVPLDHSVSVREASKPQNDLTPFENRKEARSKDRSDEVLDTASSIVFRPLFAYRKQVAQRRRVYENRRNNGNNNNNRRQTTRPKKPSYPYGYPSYGYPYYMNRDFPHVP